MTTITVPDASWYRKKSREAHVPDACPFANVHKCPRYYASIYMLGKAKLITSISSGERAKLDELWENSGLSPVIAEEDTGITSADERPLSFENFCPEVSFQYFGYYATFLANYADEMDKENGHRVAERENLGKDWRFRWAAVSACHYLECSMYLQVNAYNAKGVGRFDLLAHRNVVSLLGRMEQCLENHDPPGVLHAAASILETTAKDIVQSPNVQDRTLASFIDSYLRDSKLPPEVKGVVKRIYDLRSIMPLAAHGSTSEPHLSMGDAVLISATVKFIVEIEYRMRQI